MWFIRTTTPIPIIVHYPKTEAGINELAQRVAEVHSDIINYKVKQLRCPAKQKLEILDTIIKIVKQRSREQER